MNIAQVHNYYKNPGGEDKVLDQEKDLLQSQGVDVVQFLKDNNDLKSLWDYIHLAFNTRYSKKSYKEFCAFISKHDPDVVHVHNFFPQITPAIFDCTYEKNIPSVLTLHNYRIFHPNGLMMYEGRIDTRGLESSAYRCIADRVYRNSMIQTAVVANMIEYHKKRKTWQQKVDGFITLTQFAKNQFVKGGIPRDKIYVKPNFIPDPVERFNFSEKEQNEKEGFLFIGRISPEKGIRNLVETWMSYNTSYKLTIIGDGPLKEELQKKSSKNTSIKWLGRISNEEVYHWLRRVKALIFPSICYEGFPITILEALSMSCPVICSNIGSQQSIIDDGVTGLHFKVKNSEDLLKKVALLQKNNGLVKQLGRNARQEYLENYTPQKNYKMLTEIYRSCSNS